MNEINSGNERVVTVTPLIFLNLFGRPIMSSVGGVHAPPTKRFCRLYYIEYEGGRLLRNVGAVYQTI